MLTIASLTSILAIAAMGYQLRAFAQSTEVSRAHSLAVFISNLAQDFDFFISKTAPSLSPNFNKISSAQFSDFTKNYWRIKNSNLGINNPLKLNGVDITLGYKTGENSALNTGIILISLQNAEQESLLFKIKQILVSLESNNKIAEVTNQNTTKEFQLNTPKHSGIHPKLILRNKRSGHDNANTMDADINLAGNNITGAGHIGSENLTTSVLSKSNTISILNNYNKSAINITGNINVAETGSLTNIDAKSIAINSAKINNINVTKNITVAGDAAANSVTSPNITTKNIILKNTGADALKTPRGEIDEVIVGTAFVPTTNAKIQTSINIVSKVATFTSVTTKGCVGC